MRIENMPRCTRMVKTTMKTSDHPSSAIEFSDSMRSMTRTRSTMAVSNSAYSASWRALRAQAKATMRTKTMTRLRKSCWSRRPMAKERVPRLCETESTWRSCSQRRTADTARITMSQLLPPLSPTSPAPAPAPAPPAPSHEREWRELRKPNQQGSSKAEIAVVIMHTYRSRFQGLRRRRAMGTLTRGISVRYPTCPRPHWRMMMTVMKRKQIAASAPVVIRMAIISTWHEHPYTRKPVVKRPMRSTKKAWTAQKRLRPKRSHLISSSLLSTGCMNMLGCPSRQKMARGDFQASEI
mmetsp:Transcript_23150/g.54913  ORF Transcript_23150/g.54913 Transcript_23150/m.54913 type:complete len:295 (-) Transcript_23150:383-1267(-)